MTSGDGLGHATHPIYGRQIDTHKNCIAYIDTQSETFRREIRRLEQKLEFCEEIRAWHSEVIEELSNEPMTVVYQDIILAED